MEVTIFLFIVGYLIIVLIGVIFALVWSIRHKLGFLKTMGMVLATLLVIYGIPFGDHTLGEIRKLQLCNEHGGTKIYQVVENVDGFMWIAGRQGKPYDTYGYSFFEAQTADEVIFRYIKNRDSVLDEQKVDSPQARYLARLAPLEKLGRHHSIRRFLIIDMSDNKILASHGTVAYEGGWLRIIGSTVCPHNKFDALSLVRSVLKPAKSKD
ncbi:MAG: hypothetical protein KIT13_11190 [Burkholderiales bacterium]|nr:hypothetical protein [Burkholderiales bacterium]